MGLTVKLQDEFGEVLDVVEDVRDLVGPYIPSLSDEGYHCLRFIDRYGDTYFNRLQMDIFKLEWERLTRKVDEANEGTKVATKTVFAQISELAKKCQREPHLYLKFEGD